MSTKTKAEKWEEAWKQLEESLDLSEEEKRGVMTDAEWKTFRKREKVLSLLNSAKNVCIEKNLFETAGLIKEAMNEIENY